MKISKFFVMMAVLFVVTLIVYLVSTPHGSDIPLTGIVSGNDVIVSPQMAGQIVHLNVDEGTVVKKGDLIAEIFPDELASALASAEANINALEAKVDSVSSTRTLTDGHTSASLSQADATLTSMRSQLIQAQANLWRDQQTFKREQGLFEQGVAAAQDRDLADAAMQASAATVKSFEDQVRAMESAKNVATANRRQVDVENSELLVTKAQLLQARADRDTAKVRLGYTKIYSPLDGVVSVRAARQGEVLQAGAPIVTIIDVDHLWVQADVEESYIDSIAYGDTMRVQLPSGNIISGKVIFKGVENDFATQRDVSRTKRDIKTFSIKVSVPNPGRRLVTGMTATVLLTPPVLNQTAWQKFVAAVHPTAAPSER
jgi:HlyD family secretion protein